MLNYGKYPVKIAHYILGLMVLIACKKNDPETKPNIDNPPVEKEKTCVPLSLKVGDSLIYSFKTNSQNQVIEVISHHFARIDGNLRASYDEKGRVSQIEYRIMPGKSAPVHKYFYNEEDQTLFRLKIYENKEFGIDSFYYDANDNLIKISFYLFEDKNDKVYTYDGSTVFSNFGNGKQMKMTSYPSYKDTSQSFSNSHTFWTFGNVLNPLNFFNQYFYFYMRYYEFKNLRYLPTYKFEKGISPSDQYEYEYGYIFNEQGYPVSIKSRDIAESDTSRVWCTIDYICK